MTFSFFLFPLLSETLEVTLWPWSLSTNSRHFSVVANLLHYSPLFNANANVIVAASTAVTSINLSFKTDMSSSSSFDCQIETNRLLWLASCNEFNLNTTRKLDQLVVHVRSIVMKYDPFINVNVIRAKQKWIVDKTSTINPSYVDQLLSRLFTKQMWCNCRR